MTAPNRKGPLLESAVCRCCGVNRRCRILSEEYVWQGHKEVYSDIFVDCFGLMLSHLDGDQDEKGICATCVARLREASSFRQQVLKCEEKLLNTSILLDNDELKSEVKVEPDDISKSPPPVTSEIVPDDPQDDDMGCDDRDDDTASVKSETKAEITSKLMKQKRKLVKKVGTKTKIKRAGTLKTKKVMKREKVQKDLDIVPEPPLPPPEPSRPKALESEQKTFHNTVTVVECSYVCPFYTSFSDYYCIYCRNTFIDPDKLREHTLQHDPTTFNAVYDNKKIAQIDITRIDCRLCATPISDIDSLKHHLEKVHFKMLYNISNEFLRFKLTPNNIVCTECGACFRFFHALKKHMAEHFGTCICDVCGAHYFDERVLLIHQKTHQKNDDVLYSCKVCGKQFKSRHNRYLHEAKIHKKEAAFPCNKCDDIFFTYTLRYRHLIEVHGEQRMFNCDNCDRIYDSRKSLREHIRRSHLKIMKHQCDLCDRRFYLPSRLKEHMSTHTGERNYRCEYCGKSYPRLRGLKVHMQSHSIDKKYRCMLCNASFTQNVNLKNHMKRQHQTIDMDDSFQNNVM